MMLIWTLLVALPVVAIENRILTTRSKKSNRGLEISSEFNNIGRYRRNADEHQNDYESKIQINKTVLTNDAHDTAFVEWGGTDKGSDTIIVLTRDSNSPPRESALYVSSNYGKTFDVMSIDIKNQDVICSYIYQSPTNHRKFMLNDETHSGVIVTLDEGMSWTVHTTSFAPSYVTHHPYVEDLTLAYDANNSKLYLSRDFGKNWEALLPDKNVRDYDWSNSVYDSSQNTILLSTVDADGTLSIWENNNFFKTLNTPVDTGVYEFLVIDDFYFSIKKSTHTDHGNNDMDLFISYDRGSLVKATFPTAMLDNPTTEFYIADAGLGQVFVAVSHKDNSTNLYVSEHKGHNMMLSLERVLFTNQASFDRIRWLSGIEPFTDFQAIEGLSGVFIASQLDSGTVGHRKIKTVMTFNKGGTWQRVQPPQYDNNGLPLQCFLPNCSLHLSLIFGTKYPYAKHTPLLSKANAPGLILSSGNLGISHSTLNDLFMSNDGGVEWYQVLVGQYLYQFADHGGITVAVSRDQTSIIRYSHDEGATWLNKSISDRDLMVYGLVTEPGEQTTVFNLYATYLDKQEWVIITIDFKEFLGRQCTSYDFMRWSIRDELKNTECVLGINKIYERKIPSAHCYIGSDYKRFISNQSCPCQATDFECDFLYAREYAGDPCTLMEGIEESWFVPGDCEPGQTYFKSMGYVKIEGDLCTKGEENIFSDKEMPCPDKGIKDLSIDVTPGTAVRVGTTVTFVAQASSYLEDVYFFWDMGGTDVRSGKGLEAVTQTVTYNRSGTYVISLTASNSAGPSETMKKIDVDDKIGGLKITLSPADPVLEESMVFIVSAGEKSRNSTDITRLQYQWYTDGASSGLRTHLPLMLYTYATPGPHTVICELSNSISALNLSITFVVSDLGISSLKTIPVDSTSIQAAWNAPLQRSGVISAYTLKYRTPTSNWHEVSLPVTSTSHLASGLESDTLYTFVIITSSVSGALSKDSNMATATTLAKNTLPPPTNVQVSNSGTDADVSWKAAKSPLSYNVAYWMSDRPNTVKTHTPSKKTDTKIKISDLTAGALYSFRVEAVYSGGVSFSSVVTVQIESVTPEGVSNLISYPTNDTAVILTWSKPDSVVDGYKIYNGSDASSPLLSVTKEEAIVVHLQPYTQYSFMVAPYIGANVGTKSKMTYVTTGYGTPGPITDGACYVQGSDAVLQWHEPLRPNGPITEYYIKSRDPGVQAKLPVSVSGEKRKVIVSGLDMYQQYSLAIIAKGPEEYSLPTWITCKMTTGVPGPPTGVYVISVGVATIELLWRQPKIQDVTLSYEIQYGMVLAGKVTKLRVVNTTKLTTLLDGLYPSTQYQITISAVNAHGAGPKTEATIATTLTPVIGSVEYEIKFPSSHFADSTLNENAVKEEIVSITSLSRTRIDGVGITHSDISDVRITFWISPRDTSDSSSVSTEDAVSSLDTAVKKGNFVVGTMKAVSGSVEQVTRTSGSHHDVAEIIIPCICGLLVVLLVSGLIYYRNRYHQLKRRYRITSHYAAGDDVNMIECADEPEGVSSNEVQGGALYIDQDSTPQEPSRVQHFFKRFNYAPLVQEDADATLLDDDEEHLLPL